MRFWLIFIIFFKRWLGQLSLFASQAKALLLSGPRSVGPVQKSSVLSKDIGLKMTFCLKTSGGLDGKAFSLSYVLTRKYILKILWSSQ